MNILQSNRLLAPPGSPTYQLMCSRYSLTSPPEAVRGTFAYRDTPNFPVRYNIAPTQDIGWFASTPTASADFG
jgi:hypothetical protein